MWVKQKWHNQGLLYKHQLTNYFEKQPADGLPENNLDINANKQLDLMSFLFDII